MPRTIAHTVAHERDGDAYDLFKIIFGGDGSYFVTAPYHPHDKATVAVLTVNYAEDEIEVALEDAVELAVLDDEDRRLKLSHHPDGFLQFSGEGVRSGRNPDGSPKGIGLVSWPLFRPALGPSFVLSFSDPSRSGRPSKGGGSTLVLPHDDIEHMSVGQAGLHIVGYYFPATWREFVFRGHDGGWWIHLIHPRAQAVKPLRVVLASKTSDFPGLIGLEARPHELEEPDGEASFILTSSTGRARRNKAGELLGDQLVCMYPQLSLNTAQLPSLNYALAETPYVDPAAAERSRDAMAGEFESEQ